MKKLILVFFSLVCLSFTAKAQWYAGGTVGFGVNAGKSHSVFSYGIEPEAGYRISDRFAVGASVLLGGDASSNAVMSDVSAFNFRVKPYFRWTFFDLGRVKFFADAILSLGSTVNSQPFSDGGAKISQGAFGWGVSVAPGLICDIVDNWAFVGRVASLGVSGEGNSATFSLSVVMGPSFGVYYYF